MRVISHSYMGNLCVIDSLPDAKNGDAPSWFWILLGFLLTGFVAVKAQSATYTHILIAANEPIVGKKIDELPAKPASPQKKSLHVL